MLAASGLLNRTIGGKGFSDYKERNFNGHGVLRSVRSGGAGSRSGAAFIASLPRGSNTGLLDTFDCSPTPRPAAPAGEPSPPRRCRRSPCGMGGFALRAAGAFADRVAKGRSQRRSKNK